MHEQFQNSTYFTNKSTSFPISSRVHILAMDSVWGLYFEIRVLDTGCLQLRYNEHFDINSKKLGSGFEPGQHPKRKFLTRICSQKTK